MTPYEQATRLFRVRYLVRAVSEAGGDVTAAAAATGAHRNTISRALAEARINAWELRAASKKPVQSAAAPAQIRRIA